MVLDSVERFVFQFVVVFLVGRRPVGFRVRFHIEWIYLFYWVIPVGVEERWWELVHDDGVVAVAVSAARRTTQLGAAGGLGGGGLYPVMHVPRVTPQRDWVVILRVVFDVLVVEDVLDASIVQVDVVPVLAWRARDVQADEEYLQLY